MAIERQKGDKTAAMKRLRAQLEEAEEAKMSALRSKTSLETDLSELNLEVRNI